LNEERPGTIAERFETHRAHLKAVAYRMLGSLSEAETAVQEAWLRLSLVDPSTVDNLRGWLTTAVARVSLDMLRARKGREEPAGLEVPEPIVTEGDELDPEHQALLADSIGLALLVVLDTLAPAERVAFVLHDLFQMPFEEIAPIVGATPAAARQLASRGRRRVQGAAATSDRDLGRQREVVDAFLVASRAGNSNALLAVLHPEVMLRADVGAKVANTWMVVRSARAVGERAIHFSRLAQHARPALVNGTWGLLTSPGGRPFSIMSFVITEGKIVDIIVLSDPARIGRLALPAAAAEPER
jgi:RNA polymerase sigma-70 factor (ECF subfamily)